MVHIRLFFISLLFLLGSSSCAAEILTGTVVKVADGDTFTLLVDGRTQYRIRLHGIDAPEIKGGQPFSRVARQTLADLVAGRRDLPGITAGTTTRRPTARPKMRPVPVVSVYGPTSHP